MNARTDLPLGLVHGMPNEQYHAKPALSASGLKKLARSPLHYYSATLDPMRPASTTTPAMQAGTLAHCMLLEPNAVCERYVVKPAGLDMRTKDGKAWAASVPAEIDLVSPDQMTTARRQAEAVRALPEIAALLASGYAEASAFWIDEATGELCKCRPDWTHPVGEGVILLDLKTTVDASPEGFPRQIANFGYHRSAAWYADGYERATGVPVLGFVFAAVEADWPHAAAPYMLDDDAMSKGRAENRRLLQVYSDCKASNAWPGYPDRIQLLALPAWA